MKVIFTLLLILTLSACTVQPGETKLSDVSFEKTSTNYYVLQLQDKCQKSFGSGYNLLHSYYLSKNLDGTLTFSCQNKEIKNTSGGYDTQPLYYLESEYNDTKKLKDDLISLYGDITLNELNRKAEQIITPKKLGEIISADPGYTKEEGCHYISKLLNRELYLNKGTGDCIQSNGEKYTYKSENYKSLIKVQMEQEEINKNLEGNPSGSGTYKLITP